MDLPFVKMEACGNDYVFLYLPPGTESPTEDLPQLSRELSHRHCGVGGDGLILVEPTQRGSRMHMWNADGSTGELCLNGLRCAALLTVRESAGTPNPLVVEADAGAYEVSVVGRQLEAVVRVKLNPVHVLGSDTYDLEGIKRRGYRVDVGNPHCVLWMRDVEEVRDVSLPVSGPCIQRRGEFPNGVNVHFAAWDGARIVMRHWERGSGATMACGTGSVAAWAVARELGVSGDSTLVSMPGGDVHILGEADQPWLEGPAKECFRGTWPL